MSRLESNLRLVRRRLLWLKFQQTTFQILFYSSCIALLGLLISKLFPYELPLSIFFAGIAGASLLGSLAIMLIRRMSLFGAAVAADEKLRLKERLSSAVLLERMDDPMVQALRVDAEKRSERIHPQRDFRIENPWQLRWSALPVVAIFVASLLIPNGDLFGIQDEDKEKTVTQGTQREGERLKKSAEALRKRLEKEPRSELAKDLAPIVDEMEKLSEEMARSPVSKKRALAKLNKLSDQIRDRKKSFPGDRISKDRLPTPLMTKMTRALNRALGENNLKKAMEELTKLQEKIAKGELPEEEKDRLSDELSALAAALQDSPELAKAMAKLAAKLNLKNLNLAELTEAFEGTLSELENLDALLAEMEFLDSVLWDVEARRLALAGLGRCAMCGKALDGECLNPDCSCKDGEECICAGMCQGKTGMCKGCSARCAMGLGLRGAGRGIGNRIPDPGNPLTNFEDTKIKGSMTRGKILGAMRVAGESLKGESTVEYVEVFDQYESRAEDALVKEEIPRGYRNIVRGYFSAIQPEETSAEVASP